MGGIRECILVDTLQHHFYDLLYQFIITGLNTKGEQFPVPFGNISTTGGLRAIGVASYAVNDSIDSAYVHAVKCLSINTRVHVSWF